MKRTFNLFSLTMVLALLLSSMRTPYIHVRAAESGAWTNSLENVPLALPAGWSDGQLSDVWGSGADDVYAAGYGFNAVGSGMPLLYHNDGSGWTEATLSLPAGWSEGYLLDMWGSSASNVYLVGSGANAAGNYVPLLYHNDGSGWTNTSLPESVAMHHSSIHSVWGSSTSDLYAVGYGYPSDSMDQVPLLYHNDGTGWTEVTLSAPTGWSRVRFLDVWGSGASDVYIAGAGLDPTMQEMPLLYHNDGSGFTEATPALPAGWGKGLLSRVWGSSASNIYSVGSGEDADALETHLLYHNDGTGWTANSPALPAGWSFGLLSGVWASSSSDLYTVGAGYTGSSYLPLLYHNDGSGWTEAILSLPDGWLEGSLLSVWGSGAGKVYAIGYGFDAGGHQMPMLYQGGTDEVVCSPTITVAINADSGAGSLRQAIAEACPGGTIDFDPALAGQTIELETTLVLTKDVTIDGTGLDTPITIRGIHSTDGTANYRVFIVNDGIKVNLKGLTITRSNFTTYGDYSGGIDIHNGAILIIADCTISNNSGVNGGGIQNWNGTLIVRNSILTSNQATENGGGIYSEGGTTTLTNVVLLSNFANSGGGIYNHGDLTVINSTISSNWAEIYGGNIYNDHNLTLTESTVQGGSATRGGGIYNTNTLTVTNSTLVYNLARENGGGIYSNGPTLTVTNSTFSGNSGGGIYSSDSATVTNSILWGDNGGELSLGDMSVVMYSIVKGGYPGTGNLNIEPLLGPLADHGGFAQTMSLTPGSPAIDAGDATNCPATDQRGTTRPQGAGCDIGAYESASSYIPVTRTVTKTADTNDGVCDSDCSLREAMVAAQNGDKITFDISGMIMLDSTLPLIDKTLTIDGGSHSIAVDGAGSYQIFKVTETGHLILNHLTLQNGRGAPCFDSETNTCAGAIYTLLGNLTITNSTFSGNSARAGGAIFIEGGITDIVNSTFFGNSATFGGGILNWTGMVNVSNITFFDNVATHGGGIYNDVAFLTLTNATFSENSGEQGSDLYNEAGNVSLTNSILANSVSGSNCYINAEYAEISTNTYNLIETNAVSPNNCGTPALTDDPNLGPLTDNGGMTQTMALLPGSPAIDAGDDATCPETDQRGVTRPWGAHCDIGAYEAEQSADTIQPAVTSIVRADLSPTRAASVDFTVTFSEAVTGVDARDFALKTFGGIRGAAIIEVTGSGNVYTVTVRTGRGSGKLRLDVPARATITDLSGNPLGELPFKQGEVYKVVKHRR